VKSGVCVEGVALDADDGDDGKPKKHYAIQLALYVDALQRLGFEARRSGIILDIRGTEVRYDLNAPQGARTPETYWQLYVRSRQAVAELLSGKDKNDPAISGVCGLCPWYESCRRWAAQVDDLTGLFYVGRKVRDSLVHDTGAQTIAALCSLDLPEVLRRRETEKGFLKGIGEKTLQKTVTRARVMRIERKPVLYEDVEFPDVEVELFFDIEDDPTQEFVYMHGAYERSRSGERYLDFTATDMSEEAERDAWARFWEYVRSLLPQSFAVYYYSKHERTTYRRMRERYPEVVSPEELEWFFDPSRAIDLYGDVVFRKTDWPLGSYSLKAIAQYFGFRWRDETPSGALSIQWFNEFVTSRDEAVLDRIRKYNEDDCRATLVLKDALARMNADRQPR
jgi:uncharacterized protein